MMKYILLFILFGCSSALVPETSNPAEKLRQAHQLIGSKRVIPAEKLIQEALDIYRKEKNQEGVGDAYYAYASLYRFKTEYKKTGSYYEKASQSYRQIGYYISAAQSLSLAALFYSADNVLACKTIATARRTFVLKSKDAHKFTNPQAVLDNIKADQLKYKCK